MHPFLIAVGGRRGSRSGLHLIRINHQDCKRRGAIQFCIYNRMGHSRVFFDQDACLKSSRHSCELSSKLAYPASRLSFMESMCCTVCRILSRVVSTLSPTV